MIALVPLLVINDYFFMSGSITNFSDKLHITLCPARLKKLRPIKIIVTCQQCWSNNARSVIVIFCKNLKRYDATTLFGLFYVK